MRAHPVSSVEEETSQAGRVRCSHSDAGKPRWEGQCLCWVPPKRSSMRSEVPGEARTALRAKQSALVFAEESLGPALRWAGMNSQRAQPRPAALPVVWTAERARAGLDPLPHPEPLAETQSAVCSPATSTA